MLLTKLIVRVFVGLLATIAGLLICGVIYQWISTKLDKYRYPAPGKMVDVGGYKLHVNCTGEGKPTVVLDAGIGEYDLDWALVQPEITKFARVCSYDRAGYGWSDTSPLMRTSENMVKELHTLLKNAEIPSPYILVGHSAGGINARLYASMYPDEIVGVVLVDASHEDEIQKLPFLPKPNLSISLFLNYIGISRLLSVLPQVQKMAEPFPHNIRSMYLAKRFTTKFVKTVIEEISHLEESSKQLKAVGGLLGDKPLIVISAGKQITKKDSTLSQEQVDVMNKIISELQVDLVNKSTKGKQVIAEHSGHLINIEQPEIIVEAVHGIAEQIT